MTTRLLGSLCLAAAVLGWNARAADDPRTLLRRGATAYQEKKFEDALRLFEEAAKGATSVRQDPAVPALNAGNALMRLDRQLEAAQRYLESLRSPDLSLQARASFNRGNALYRMAEVGQQNGLLDQAAKSIGEAVLMYERAVLLDARDMDAKINYELALRKKQEIEQQVQQQPQSQQQQAEQEKEKSREPSEEKPEDRPPSADQPRPEAGPEQERREAGQPEQAEAMTPEEARMLLDKLKLEEQAYREQLRVIMGAPVPVEKDW